MNKKKLENKICSAFETESSDLFDTISKKCDEIEILPPVLQEKKSFSLIYFKPLKVCLSLVICALIFCVGIVSGMLIPSPKKNVSAKAESTVCLDVNPSITLSLSSDNKVVSYHGNDDSIKILEDLQLEGVEINTAVNALIGSLYIKGYITEEKSSVLISVNAKNDDKSNSLLSSLKTQIQDYFSESSIHCSIITQSFVENSEIENLSKIYDISEGKISYILSQLSERYKESINTKEKPTIQDLINFLEENGGSFQKLVSSALSDLTSLFDSEIKLTKDEAFELALNDAELKQDQVKSSSIFLLPEWTEENQLCYLYYIYFRDSSYKIYYYKVNSESGKVMKVDKFSLSFILNGN